MEGWKEWLKSRVLDFSAITAKREAVERHDMSNYAGRCGQFYYWKTLTEHFIRNTCLYLCLCNHLGIQCCHII